MEIVNLTHNDDLFAIARKCNTNFKRLASSINQSVKKQSRIDSEVTAEDLANAVNTLVQVAIPNEVTAQIASADIAGQVATEVSEQITAADIPQMVSDEVASQVSPPVGAYVMSDTMPSYPGTTWVQADTVTTTGSLVIPLWERTA